MSPNLTLLCFQDSHGRQPQSGSRLERPLPQEFQLKDSVPTPRARGQAPPVLLWISKSWHFLTPAACWCLHLAQTWELTTFLVYQREYGHIFTWSLPRHHTSQKKTTHSQSQRNCFCVFLFSFSSFLSFFFFTSLLGFGEFSFVYF